jgi:hypothetical protein
VKLEKKYFNNILVGENCIFRNEFGEYIYCTKFGKEKIFHNNKVKYTGQEHSCYLVSNITLIDKVFAEYQWYLKKQWAKVKKMESKKYGI